MHKKVPCDRHPQTDDDREYLKALSGDRHRFGLSFPVLTNEDWGGSYFPGHRTTRYPSPDEYGPVDGGYLDVHVVIDPATNRFWISVWGTDDFSMMLRCHSAEEVEAALRRFPIIVDRETLRSLGFNYE